MGLTVKRVAKQKKKAPATGRRDDPAMHSSAWLPSKPPRGNSACPGASRSTGQPGPNRFANHKMDGQRGLIESLHCFEAKGKKSERGRTPNGLPRARNAARLSVPSCVRLRIPDTAPKKLKNGAVFAHLNSFRMVRNRIWCLQRRTRHHPAEGKGKFP